MEPLQAAVDFQPFRDQLAASYSDFIFPLNLTRESEQPSSHKRCNYQKQLLHPREFPSAAALQQRQQRLAECLVV
jgi:hypothetical protein